MPARCDGMQIALSKQDVVDPLEFHRSAILGFKEHRVANFHAAYVRPDGHYGSPVQPSPDLGVSRNDDAATALALTIGASLANENAIVEQFDRDRAIRPGSGIRRSSGGSVRGGQRRRRPNAFNAT